ncbi:MAG: hypothetical protein QXX74_03730 [Candidatus Micrarchaeaceae archaeon]
MQNQQNTLANFKKNKYSNSRNNQNLNDVMEKSVTNNPFNLKQIRRGIMVTYYDDGYVKLAANSDQRYFFIYLKGIADPVARLIVDLKNGRIEDIYDYGNEENLKLALIIAQDIPFRDALIKHFGIKFNEDDERLLANLKSAQERDKEIKRKYKTKVKLPAYETTDPNEYNPNDFRFIVHALSIDRNGPTQQALVNAIAGAWGTKVENDNFSNPLEHPEEFVKRTHISCSVIDEVHTGTWREGGFILKVPKTNILRAAPDDLGSIALKDDNGDPYIPSLQEILERTSPYVYNEIVVKGIDKKSGNQIEIAGAFIIIDPITGKAINKTLENLLINFCNKHNLPLIRIIKSL